MAEEKKTVTLYHPGGTEVQVSPERAEVLKERGYTTTAPKQQSSSSRSQ